MENAKTKDQEFRAWCREVSALCEQRFGLALDDLPDLPTRDAFDQGVTPQDFFDGPVTELAHDEFGSLVLWTE